MSVHPIPGHETPIEIFMRDIRNEHPYAIGAIESYAGHQANIETRTRTVEHPLRICSILNDFVGDSVPPEAFKIAIVHDLPSRIENIDTRKNALGGLALFADSLDASTHEEGEITEAEYVLGMLSGTRQAEDLAEDARRTLYGDREELARILNKKTRKEEVFDDDVWLEPSVLIDPDKMLRLLQEVSDIPVLVKAAEIYDNLKNPSTKAAAVIQDVFDAESLYAPILEVLGYDGFAMAIRDVAFETRLRRSGNEVYLDKAQEIIDQLGTRDDIIARINELFSEITDGHILDAVTGESLGLHDIKIGELYKNSRAGEDVLPEILRGVWRVKSRGSLAMKMFENGHGKVPMDVLGITIIPKDIESVSRYFSQLVEKLDETEDIHLTPSPSRDSALHVRGTQEFTSTILASSVVEHGVDIKVNGAVDSSYQVAKVTFIYQGINVEIQVLTETDRVEARTGKSAHIFDKAKRLGAVDKDTGLLKAIKEFRGFGVNGKRHISLTTARAGQMLLLACSNR